jgi:oligopeptide/dipeptide ABC transporter ATP-binding protein
MTFPLLAVRGLAKHFPIRGGFLNARTTGQVKAVDGVSFDVAAGETLAIVGESGCGKSTTGRMLLCLTEPTSGTIAFEGDDLLRLSRRALHERRRSIQMVFQDPYGSLSPRQHVEDIVAEPLDVYGLYRGRDERRDRVADLLYRVGLNADHMRRYPFEFSGGQRQRIAIARALASGPKLIVADEPVSALDVSIQSQVINLLQDLQDQLGIAYIFISHDLAVVRHVAHRIAVMYLGRIVEMSESEAMVTAPHHPYTQALFSAAPLPKQTRASSRIILRGEVPNPSRVPSGCHFHPRCPVAAAICSQRVPPLAEVAAGRWAACHFARPFPITAKRSGIA